MLPKLPPNDPKFKSLYLTEDSFRCNIKLFSQILQRLIKTKTKIIFNRVCIAKEHGLSFDYLTFAS